MMLRRHLTNKAFIFVCFLVFFFVYFTSGSPAEETKKAKGEETNPGRSVSAWSAHRLRRLEPVQGAGHRPGAGMILARGFESFRDSPAPGRRRRLAAGFRAPGPHGPGTCVLRGQRSGPLAFPMTKAGELERRGFSHSLYRSL